MTCTTVLIPTDFSANSWHAMQYAANLFAHEKVKYILLNTFHAAPPNVQAVTVDFVGPLSKASKEGLENMISKFKSLNHNPETVFVSQNIYGDMIRIVKDLTNEMEIEYIVMGTKGASGLKEIFMGSNTVSVINNATCPVICVPENAKIEAPTKIILPSDFEDINNPEDILPLKHIAWKHDAHVLVLILRNKHTEPVSVRDAREDFNLDGYLSNVTHDIYIRSEENVEEGIQAFAHEQKANMVAMITRKHTFWESLFKSSITKKMAFHTDIPLLVLHESNNS